MISTCKLCLNERPLQDSHIIPEFVFKPLYDEKHRMRVLSVNAKNNRPYEQKGPREKLLCESCECYLSKYENYGRQVFDEKVVVSQNNYSITYKGIEYRRFKLFLLSVVWRASVSSLVYFRQLKLGPHEEVIRTMILNNDPGLPEKYGIIPFLLLDEGEIRTDLIIPPTTTRLDGHKAYNIGFGGVMWCFIISNHSTPPKCKPLFISENETTSFFLSELRQYRNIMNFAMELKSLDRI